VNDTQSNCSSLTYDNSASTLVGNPTQITAGGTTGTTPGSCGSAGSSSTANRYQAGDSGAQPCLTSGGPWPGKGELCSSTNPDGATTAYSYDQVGNPTGSTPPASSNTTTAATAGSTLKPTSQTVDAISRVATRTDGNGNVTAYWYDNNDRVIEVVYGYSAPTTPARHPRVRATPTAPTLAHDPDGNLVTQTDATGTTTNSYDHLNHLTSSAKAGTTKSYAYDNVGNLATYTDQAGTVTYSYDPANNVLSAANTSAGSTSCPSYASGTAPVNCVVYNYDNDHRRTGTRVPGGVTQTVTCDQSGRPTDVATSATTPAAGVAALNANIAYGYSDPATGKDSNLVWAYAGGNISYDPLNRVTSVTYGGHTWS
jgi:YD repeat-containing protein